MGKVKCDTAILVVDDDAMVMDVLVDYLKELGMTNITQARNSTHALKLLQDPEFKVELVLSDWEMPQVDGLTLLKAIRKNPLRRRLRFIMVTSQRSMERFKVTQAARWQVSAYILKPFRLHLLKEKLWSVMGWEQDKNSEKVG
ncbi:MAG: response regulator [Pseudobdellovibrionaceae bacterium]|nr:response regulator [Bdellovibrionales bacterium]USN48476.1 MAG: response regulator [Pseudobdellovibrionaceae bacterium]